MRIAQLANFVGPTSGGMKVALEQLGRGYAASGAVRLLIIPSDRTRVRRTPAGMVVEVNSPRVIGGYRVIVDARPVLAALEHFEPTSLELSDKWTLLPVTTWARRRGIPTWLFSHERLDAMLPGRLGCERVLTRPVAKYTDFVARRCDGVIVTSNYAREEFNCLGHGPIVRQVPLGVDLTTFAPRLTPRPDGPLRLVHFGRLSREKHPQYAVSTAVELHRRGVPVRLDVYGTGPHLRQLRELAGAAPVYFHGHIGDRHQLAAAVGRADVSLSVSPHETFGLAVLEALSCGTPVVTANRGGASELVTALCGASAEPTPSALADAVERLCEIPEWQRRTQARARALRYPWSRSVHTMLSIHADGWGTRQALAS